MQDALLFPTCSMANEVALMLLARPGETVLAQPDVHILTSEAGAPAALGGLHVRAVDGTTLCPPARAWAELACPPGDVLTPAGAAVALEKRTTAVAAWHARAPTRMRCWPWRAAPGSALISTALGCSTPPLR